jgi:hypothetical protein
LRPKTWTNWISNKQEEIEKLRNDVLPSSSELNLWHTLEKFYAETPLSIDWTIENDPRNRVDVLVDQLGAKSFSVTVLVKVLHDCSSTPS